MQSGGKHLTGETRIRKPFSLEYKKSKPTNVLLGEFKDTKFKIIGEFNKSTFLAPDYYINFKTAKNPILHELVKKIHNKSIEIKNVADVKMGIVAYLKGDGIPTQTRDDVKNRIYHSYEQETEEYFKYFQGKDIKRYKYQWNGQWIKYGKNLARRGQAYLFENERLLIKQIPSTLPYCLNAVYVNEHIINDINSTIITNFKKDPYFLLAIINSKLTSFWFVIYFDKLQRKIFPQFKGSELKKFPIPKTNINAEQNLTTFAKQMLLLNKNLQTKSEKLINRIKSNLDIKKISYKLQNFYDFDFKTFISELKKQKIKLTLKKQDEWEDYFDNYKKEINNLQQQIKHTDTEIDRVIYELYELTSQEINIIEKLV